MSLSDSHIISWVSNRVGLQLQHTANKEQTAPLLIKVSRFWFSEYSKCVFRSCGHGQQLGRCVAAGRLSNCSSVAAAASGGAAV